MFIKYTNLFFNYTMGHMCSNAVLRRVPCQCIVIVTTQNACWTPSYAIIMPACNSLKLKLKQYYVCRAPGAADWIGLILKNSTFFTLLLVCSYSGNKKKKHVHENVYGKFVNLLAENGFDSWYLKRQVVRRKQKNLLLTFKTTTTFFISSDTFFPYMQNEC